MPGISFISSKMIDKDLFSKAIDDLKTEHQKIRELYYDNNFALTITGHEAYPYWYYENDETVIAFEGMVYNVKTEAVKKEIISLSAEDKEHYKNTISAMIENYDGDFLCVIYFKKSTKCLIFNDCYGRLPTFFSHSNEKFMLSREMKFILHFLSSIVVDRIGMANFFIWEQKLSTDTMIKNISRLSPAVLINNKFNKKTQLHKITTLQMVNHNFDVIEPINDKSKCASDITELFLTSLKNRHTTCSSRGYKNIADVSGGFDTRGVVMGLERLNLDVDYYTLCIVTGDESKIAKALCDAYGKKITTISASHELNHEMGDFIYATDCMINVWTGLTSWRDSYQKWSAGNQNAANFTGLGGEYIRHPVSPAPGYHSLNDMIHGQMIYTLQYPELAGYLAGLKQGEYEQYLDCHFNSYPEDTFEGKLKRYGCEYRKVVNAGEDRIRHHFWTASPFLGVDLRNYMKKHFPLKLSGYSFYVDVLKNIGSKGLHVPIHDKYIKPHSDFIVACYDFNQILKTYLRTLIFKNGYNNLITKIRRKRASKATYDTLFQQIIQARDKLTVLSEVIPRYRIEYFYDNIIGTKYDTFYFYRLLSVLLYFKQLEKRFIEKLVVE